MEDSYDFNDLVSEWSFGVHTDAQGFECVHGFQVTWNSTGSEFDYCDKSEIEHRRCNGDSKIKGEISDYSYYKKLEKLSKLTRNLTVGTAAQATIACFREHASVNSNR